jgi:hypothetical protein
MSNNMNLKVLLAWGFVGIPLLWGVSQTLAKALLLFH